MPNNDIRFDPNDTAYDLMTDDGLSMELASLDHRRQYDVHQAIWWNTDTPIPMAKRLRKERKLKLAVPVVWKTAPKYILDDLLSHQVNCWHNYQTIEGKELKEYMKSRQFLSDMRALVPHFQICRDNNVSEARRKANVLLSDRPSKIRDIVVSWREEPADLLFSPIASTNPYARIIWLDPALKEAPQELLNWVVYHEFCLIVSTSLVNGRPKKNMMVPLEERFEHMEEILDVMDVMGYHFEHDMRRYEQRKEEDSASKDQESQAREVPLP